MEQRATQRSFSWFFRRLATVVVVCALVVGLAGASGGAEYKVVHRPALVLAMFGTTVEPALAGLLNIRRLLQERYPATPVRIAFTSNIIRKIWQKRAADPAYRAAHPEIPDDILHVQGVLATMANLQDAGYDTLVVQPTHLTPGEEFLDLTAYVDGLAGIQTIKAKYKPFHKIALGRPALGTFGTRHPYAEDIAAVARVLAADVAAARQQQAALVYMGHGNEHFPSGGSYLELEERLRHDHPDVPIHIGCVEGFPSFQRVLAGLQREGVRRVLLVPLMVVAGDHAMNDMAGPEPDSWKSQLEKRGITVEVLRRGLGELDGFAAIFADHAAAAAADAGITLE